MDALPYAAIVLAGGRGARLGGVHKPGLVVGGRSLLERVLAAIPDAAPLVVVGPPQPVPPGTVLIREEPAGSGPVAALAAGVALLPPEVGQVAVLAADLPFLTADVIVTLRAACPFDASPWPTADPVPAAADPAPGTANPPAGAVLVDSDGRDQYLAGVWQAAALRRAIAEFGDPAGGSMRRLLGDLNVVRIGVEVGATAGSGRPAPWFDCDDPDDLRTAERWTTST